MFLALSVPAFVAPFAGVYIDRFSRRTAFLTIFAGFLVGTLLCGLAPDYQLLVAVAVFSMLMVANSGGTSISYVDLTTTAEARRFQTPNAALWQLTFDDEGGTVVGFGSHALVLGGVVLGSAVAGVLESVGILIHEDNALAQRIGAGQGRHGTEQHRNKKAGAPRR